MITPPYFLKGSIFEMQMLTSARSQVLINFPEISEKLLEIARTRINITRNLRKDKMAKIHVRPGPKTSSVLLSPQSMASMQINEMGSSVLQDHSSFRSLVSEAHRRDVLEILNAVSSLTHKIQGLAE